MYQLWTQGRIESYNILAAGMIDCHPAECEWIRDFIAAH